MVFSPRSIIASKGRAGGGDLTNYTNSILTLKTEQVKCMARVMSNGLPFLRYFLEVSSPA